MANLKELKTKQTSIQSINKITSAMQMVATAKSQKAIKALRAYSYYYEKVNNMIIDIFDDKKAVQYNNTFWIVITSDLGLVGGYNGNVLKLLKANHKKGDRIFFIGTKSNFIKKDYPDAKSISNSDVEVGDDNRLLIFTEATEAYFEKNMAVKIIYTSYISQISFEAKIETVLPFVKKSQDGDKKAELNLMEFEPSRPEVLEKALEIYLRTMFVYYYREAIAAEHSSRRMAMENATKNGNDLLRDLKIEFNRVRQAKITQEISEIIGGSEALK